MSFKAKFEILVHFEINLGKVLVSTTSTQRFLEHSDINIINFIINNNITLYEFFLDKIILYVNVYVFVS